MDAAQAIEHLRTKRLVYTVTSGRSGSKLLTALGTTIGGVHAAHEAPPRMNYVMRGILQCPEAAGWWLQSEMYPAIAGILDRPVFLESSHLFCKGFIEPTLELGLRPAFILLHRPASAVAESLHAIGCIPARTGIGKLVLLAPDDPGTDMRADWTGWTDYQLCYWYAREIERRQAHYGQWLPGMGCDCMSVTLEELGEAALFPPLAAFIAGRPDPDIDLQAVDRVLARNQNPKTDLAGDLRAPPEGDLRGAQEAQIDACIAESGPFDASRAALRNGM